MLTAPGEVDRSSQALLTVLGCGVVGAGRRITTSIWHS
jgi:hypothetical protein